MAAIAVRMIVGGILAICFMNARGEVTCGARSSIGTAAVHVIQSDSSDRRSIVGHDPQCLAHASPKLQPERLIARVHRMAVGTHAHATSTLLRDYGIGTRPAKSADTARACKGFLQYAQSPAASTVYLDRAATTTQSAAASG